MDDLVDLETEAIGRILNKVDADDEPDGGDHEVQDRQVRGHVHLCHGVAQEIQLFNKTGVLFDVCDVQSDGVAHTD